MTGTTAFNTASNGFFSDFWLHALVIIPIEFGILHSTPLGPMLSGWFEGLWSAAGFEFAGHAATHTAAETAVQTATEIAAPIPPEPFAKPLSTFPGKFCHPHGTELVCH
jgi:hypothetical protein